MTLTAHRTDAASAPVRTLNDIIPVRLGLVVGVLWVALIGFILSITPAPSGDPAALDLTVSILFELFLVATVAGLVTMRRWGLAASMGAAGLMFAAAGLCSLGGHTGTWLVAQYVAAVTMFVVSRAAFRQV